MSSFPLSSPFIFLALATFLWITVDLHPPQRHRGTEKGERLNHEGHEGSRGEALWLPLAFRIAGGELAICRPSTSLLCRAQLLLRPTCLWLDKRRPGRSLWHSRRPSFLPVCGSQQWLRRIASVSFLPGRSCRRRKKSLAGSVPLF